MKKGFITKVLVGMLLMVTTAFGVTNAWAAKEAELPDIYLQISPVSTRLDMNPGDKHKGTIKVSNIGKLAFDFKVYASPFNLEDLTYYQNFVERGNYNKIVNWITFSKLTYKDLKPGKTVEVKYAINVPKNAPGGGQYAVIFAETAGNNSAESSIQTINRVGHTIYATIKGDTNEAGELISVDQKGLFFGGNIESTTIIKNSGNVDFNSTHTLKIESIFGNELYRDTKNFPVIAETSRQIDREWKETPMVGLFKVTNDINFMGKNQYNETKLVLVMPIWLIISILVVIVVLIVLIAVKIKKAKRTPKRAL